MRLSFQLLFAALAAAALALPTSDKPPVEKPHPQAVEHQAEASTSQEEEVLAGIATARKFLNNALERLTDVESLESHDVHKQLSKIIELVEPLTTQEKPRRRYKRHYVPLDEDDDWTPIMNQLCSSRDILPDIYDMFCPPDAMFDVSP